MKYNYILFFGLLSFIFSSFLKESSLNYYNDEQLSFGIEDDLKNKKFVIKCMLVSNFTVYDISSLSKSVENEPYDYDIKIDNKTIVYNFCKDLSSKTCTNGDNINSQLAIKNDDKSCNAWAGSIDKGNTWEILQTDNDTEMNITLNKINNKTVKYILRCNKDIDNKDLYSDQKFKIEGNYTDDDEIILIFRSYYVCPKIDFYVLWKFINKYKIIFSIIMIIIGLLLAILGYYFIKPTIFLISTLAVIIVVFVVFFQWILPSGTKDWVVWVVLGVSIILGVTLGILACKYKKTVFAFILGGVTGFFIGEFLFNIFARLFSSISGLIWQIVFIVVSMIILMILCYLLFSILVIFSTSFLGSYMSIRGLSLICGGFPSEFTIIDLAKAGETEQIKELFTFKVYLYLGAIVILFIASLIIQFKIKSKTLLDIEYD